MALLAPMPRASVKIAMIVKAGDFTSIRHAYLISDFILVRHLFDAQRNYRVDAGSAPRRYPASNDYSHSEDDGSGNPRDEIRCRHFAPLTFHCADDAISGKRAGGETQS